jgi:hypothetical protein
MIHHFLMFLVSETSISSGQAQATIHQPPATRRPVPGSSFWRLRNLKLIASVVGNTFGFSVFLGTCWMGLYLMHTLN